MDLTDLQNSVDNTKALVAHWQQWQDPTYIEAEQKRTCENLAAAKTVTEKMQRAVDEVNRNAELADSKVREYTARVNQLKKQGLALKHENKIAKLKKLMRDIGQAEQTEG